jgi:hypothetical protein
MVTDEQVVQQETCVGKVANEYAAQGVSQEPFPWLFEHDYG